MLADSVFPNIWVPPIIPPPLEKGRKKYKSIFSLLRLLGALLSAHLLILDKSKPFGDLEPEWYDGELLEMASDLASRLLPAFDNSKTGLPHPRVCEDYGNSIPCSPSLSHRFKMYSVGCYYYQIRYYQTRLFYLLSKCVYF